MKKKCRFCNKTTYKLVSDFSKTGWFSIHIEGEKIVYSCPEHRKEMKGYMIRILEHND